MTMSSQHTITEIDSRKGTIHRGVTRQDLQAEVRRLLNSPRVEQATNIPCIKLTARQKMSRTVISNKAHGDSI